jgi:hypothetical protein
MMRIGTLLAASALALGGCAINVVDAPAPVAPVASNPADLAAIHSTILAVYDVISGPPGQKRDFDRMRSLFAPGATMKAIGPRGVGGGSVEDYIRRNAEILEKEGFTEHELGRRVEVWGNLATAWSAYDGRTANGSFHERGINSFQLVKINGKWLVASILWQEERPDNPLPADLTNGASNQ